LIRIDPTIRRNAGARIDDKISVRKVDPKTSEKVRLAPTQLLRIGEGAEEYLKRFLMNRPLVKGDLIELNVMGRRIDLTVINVKPRRLLKPKFPG
jgi:transitional endoplasmic reticulum ATPase